MDKNGEGIIDPAARLICYQIRNVPGEPGFTRRDVDVSNQFGDSALTLIKSRLLCVPSSLRALP